MLLRVFTLLFPLPYLLYSPPAFAGDCKPAVVVIDVSNTVPDSGFNKFLPQEKKARWEALRDRGQEVCVTEGHVPHNARFNCAVGDVTPATRKRAKRLNRQRKPSKKLARRLEMELGVPGLVIFDFAVRKGRVTMSMSVIDLHYGRIIAQAQYARLTKETWVHAVEPILASGGSAYCSP